MKKSLALILLCVTFFPGLAQAQPRVYLGFGLGTNVIMGKNLPAYQEPYSVGPALNLGLKLNKNFSLESRWGVLFTEELGGSEIGFYAKGDILQDFLYAVGGINYLNSSGKEHGNLINEQSYEEFHGMLGGGFGIHSPDDFFLEVQYFKTLNDKFGATSFLDANMQPVVRYWTVHSIIKISLGYNFSLTSKTGKETREEKPVMEKKETEESAVEIAPGRRHLFLSFGTGFPELLNTQLGYQIMDHLSLAGIFNWSILQHREFKKFTAGLRLTGYFSGSALNNISLEYSKQLENIFTGNNEGPVTLTVGRDNLFPDSRFHFFWAAGLTEWFNPWGRTDRLSPVIKIGTNLNFF